MNFYKQPDVILKIE